MRAAPSPHFTPHRPAFAFASRAKSLLSTFYLLYSYFPRSTSLLQVHKRTHTYITMSARTIQLHCPEHDLTIDDFMITPSMTFPDFLLSIQSAFRGHDSQRHQRGAYFRDGALAIRAHRIWGADPGWSRKWRGKAASGAEDGGGVVFGGRWA